MPHLFPAIQCDSERAPGCEHCCDGHPPAGTLAIDERYEDHRRDDDDCGGPDERMDLGRDPGMFGIVKYRRPASESSFRRKPLGLSLLGVGEARTCTRISARH